MAHQTMPGAFSNKPVRNPLYLVLEALRVASEDWHWRAGKVRTRSPKYWNGLRIRRHVRMIAGLICCDLRTLVDATRCFLRVGDPVNPPQPRTACSDGRASRFSNIDGMPFD